MIATKGYGAPETVLAFDRAQQLAAQVGDSSQIFTLLFGKWVAQHVKAEQHQIARQIAEQFLSLAQQQTETGPLVIAHRILGFSLVLAGEIQSAHNQLEQALALFDPEQHHPLTFRFGQHPGVNIHSLLGWSLWLLGYSDHASQACQEALRIARVVNHTNTLCYALLLGGCMVHQYQRDVGLVAEKAQMVIEISQKEGLDHWLGGGRVMEGWTLVERGQPEVGVPQILKGLADMKATRTRLGFSHLWGFIGRRLRGFGTISRGLKGYCHGPGLCRGDRRALLGGRVVPAQGRVVVKG